MLIGRIQGATHDIKETASTPRLIARMAVTPFGPVFSSAWFPTPKEIERLNAGAPVYVHLYGGHPHAYVVAGEIPRDEHEKLPGPGAYVPIEADRWQKESGAGLKGAAWVVSKLWSLIQPVERPRAARQPLQPAAQPQQHR